MPNNSGVTKISTQLAAYADGKHVFMMYFALTTTLCKFMRKCK